MTIWYKAGHHSSTLIDEVEVIEETEQFITYTYDFYGKGGTIRSKKRSNYDNYFKTREEAVEFLLEKAEKRAEYAKRASETALKDLLNLRQQLL